MYMYLYHLHTHDCECGDTVHGLLDNTSREKNSLDETNQCRAPVHTNADV